MTKKYQTLTAEQVLDQYLVTANMGTLQDFASPADALHQLLQYERDVERFFTREEMRNKFGAFLLRLHEQHKHQHNYYLAAFNEFSKATKKQDCGEDQRDDASAAYQAVDGGGVQL